MTLFVERSLNMQMTVTFRLARQEDLPKLEWYGQYTHFRPLFRRTFREQLQGHRLMIVADCSSFPIGQIFVQLRNGENRMIRPGQRAYLYSLRVMEMFQGKGIGTQLLAEAEAIIHSMGYHSTTLSVAKDNVKARRLYERVGYHVFGDDDGRWNYTDHRGLVRHVHEPCWLMEKYLTLR
jgi:ribosomal protein S18 acetylase RimI-like enzyme